MNDRLWARCQICAAAVLWSLSGLFIKALANPTRLGVHEPPVALLTIAAFRSLFAGLALLPLLRGRPRPPVDAKLCGTVACFALMSASFIIAMTTGQAAVAILLQYTAPLWLLIASVAWLGEKIVLRDVLMLIGGLAGMTVILCGNWTATEPLVLGCALASGVTYAAVLLGLRIQRDRSVEWITACNLLGTAAVLAPAFVIYPLPTPAQLIWLALFGLLQMALPYWLMARGLRHVPSFEAGLLTLIEPVLNPLWAWMVAGDAERPAPATLIGGALILVALALRYVPWSSILIAK